jgi:hypothetical protein
MMMMQQQAAGNHRAKQSSSSSHHNDDDYIGQSRDKRFAQMLSTRILTLTHISLGL